MHHYTQHMFVILALTLSGFIIIITEAHAYSEFVDEIPSIVTGDSCGTCHGAGSKRNRNAFGKDVRATLPSGPDWTVLFSLDSDGDGYTNGQELGDPNGVWFYNEPSTTFISAPGLKADTPCGNNQIGPKVSGSEACDGTDLDGKTCVDFGGSFRQTLLCTDSCEFDASACMGGNTPDDMGPDMMVEDETPDISPEDEAPDVNLDDSSRDTSTTSDSTPDDSSNDQSEVDAPIDLASIPPTPTSGKDDGCSQANAGGPSPTNALMGLLGILGLFCLRRRT